LDLSSDIKAIQLFFIKNSRGDGGVGVDFGRRKNYCQVSGYIHFFI